MSMPIYKMLPMLICSYLYSMDIIAPPEPYEHSMHIIYSKNAGLKYTAKCGRFSTCTASQVS